MKKLLLGLTLLASMSAFSSEVAVSNEGDDVLVEFTGEAAKKVYDQITYRPSTGTSMSSSYFSYKTYIKIGKEVKCSFTDYTGANTTDKYKCGISVDYKGRVNTPNKLY